MISVIIPVYNTVKMLDKCLASIANQTYQDMEVILIDDGSTDGSEDICDLYANMYPNIFRVFHQENRGLSVARNLGISVSTGDYIGFVDSDDFIEPCMFEKMYNAIQKYRADIVVEYYNVWRDGCNYYPHMEKDVCVYDETNHDEIYQNFFNEKRGITTLVWNKLYKKELFRNLLFLPNAVYEDKMIMHYLLERARKIVYTNDWSYNYCINENGIASSRTYETAKWDYLATKDRYEFFMKKEDISLRRLASVDLLNQSISFLKDNVKKSRMNVAGMICQEYNTVFKKIRLKDLKSLKDKVKFISYHLISSSVVLFLRGNCSYAEIETPYR